jgi:hypothetical protein
LAILAFLPAPAVTPAVQASLPASRPPAGDSFRSPAADRGFGAFPLQFIPNRGQKAAEVAFYVEGRDKTIYFTPEGLTFVIYQGPAGPGPSARPRRTVAKLDFVGSRKGLRPAGLERSGTIVSYFTGRPEEWKKGLEACSKIVYRDLWPGIDLVYSGTVRRMKYEFVVRPGADPSRIRLAYRGVDGLSLDAEGRLLVSAAGGGFTDDAPVAYQEIDGLRRDVPAAFDLADGAGTSAASRRRDGARAYGFAVGEFDRSRTLVLDPSSLVYCGFIGGEAIDEGVAIAVGPDGSAYVTGNTPGFESTFPVTVGPDLTYNGGYSDVFVAKVDPSGTGLVYCGFIGGAEDDSATAIAAGADGSAYVAGTTRSTETSFPVAVGPGLVARGFEDAFVAKVDPSGAALAYCGYIAGPQADFAAGIAVDAAGSAYVTGRTDSDQAGFPVAVGPDLTFNGLPGVGGSDAFVAKVGPSGTGFAYCGYIGSSGSDSGQGIAVDAAGSAFIVGTTAPHLDDWGDPVPPLLPFAVGPDLSYNGIADVFVAKVDPPGTGLAYCGLIGGASSDWGVDIAVDGSGNAHVVGTTYSTEETFPVAVGPDLTFNDVFYNDAFVAAVGASGEALLYCGYIGGDEYDTPSGIAADAAGNAYVVGTTTSSQASFPAAVGPGLVRKDSPDSSSDAFLAKIAPSGGELLYCGFISGHRSDSGRGIAVDAEGHAFVTGTTISSDGWWGFFPAITGPSVTFNGWGSEAFVAKVKPVPAVSAPEIVSIQPASVAAGEPGITLVIEGSDFVEGAYARWDGSYRPTTFIDDTELRAELTEGDVSAGRIGLVSVCNPDGETSGDLELTINNPVPSLETLIPTFVTGGGGNRSLRLLGANFVPNSVVRWSGTAGNTYYLNGTILDAEVPDAEFAAGGAFQITVENPAPAGGASSALVFSVSTFTLTPSTTSATVDAGDSAAYTVLLQPQFASFDNPVVFSCQGLPQGCTGTFFPAGPTPGTNWLETVLTVKTKARRDASAAGLAARAGSGPAASAPAAFVLPLLALALAGCAPSLARRRRGPLGSRLRALSWILLVLVLAGCGASDSGPDTDFGTPAGTYPITVRGTSGTLTVSTEVTLVVR